MNILTNQTKHCIHVLGVVETEELRWEVGCHHLPLEGDGSWKFGSKFAEFLLRNGMQSLVSAWHQSTSVVLYAHPLFPTGWWASPSPALLNLQPLFAMHSQPTWKWKRTHKIASTSLQNRSCRVFNSIVSQYKIYSESPNYYIKFLSAMVLEYNIKVFLSYLGSNFICPFVELLCKIKGSFAASALCNNQKRKMKKLPENQMRRKGNDLPIKSDGNLPMIDSLCLPLWPPLMGSKRP